MDDAAAMVLVERMVEELNRARPAHLQIELVERAGDEFVLAFPNEDLPEGVCMDQRFTEIQWLLHDAELDTGIQGGEFDEDAAQFRVRYKFIHW